MSDPIETMQREIDRLEIEAGSYKMLLDAVKTLADRAGWSYEERIQAIKKLIGEAE